MLKISKAGALAIKGQKLITVYGNGGVGKTTFATNNNRAPKTLIIGMEDDGGLISVTKLPVQIGDNIDAIMLDYSVGSPAGAVVTVIEQIKNNGYEVIIFDPFTNLRSKQAGWLAVETQVVTITQRQWGEVASAMNIIFDKILELKQSANVIIIAHEERKQINDNISGNETFIIQPALGKGLLEKATQYSDEIVRISIENDGRMFDLGAKPNVTTKTRKYGSLEQEQKIMVGLSIEHLLYNE